MDWGFCQITLNHLDGIFSLKFQQPEPKVTGDPPVTSCSDRWTGGLHLVCRSQNTGGDGDPHREITPLKSGEYSDMAGDFSDHLFQPTAHLQPTKPSMSQSAFDFSANS